MNAWTQLLEVQALDTVLTQLEHRSARLPERTRLAEVEQGLVDLRARVEAAEAEKHELVRAQKRIEDEVALIEDKVAKAESQLYASGSDVKQAQALQDEIAAFRARISTLEDDELDLMEQVEPIDERLGALEQERAGLDEQAVALTKAIAEAEAEIDAEADGVRTTRAEVVAGIVPDAVAEYEAVRSRLGGVAVARLEPGGVCGACHMKLSAVEHDRILHLDPDEPVRCEDCGRFLVRG